ncbi:hypothetical protein ACFX13_017753 [Malus domestica]
MSCEPRSTLLSDEMLNSPFACAHDALRISTVPRDQGFGEDGRTSCCSGAHKGSCKLQHIRPPAVVSPFIYLASAALRSLPRRNHLQRVCNFNRPRKMSGEEEVAVPIAEPVAAAAALGEPMDLLTALQLVLRKSLAHGGLTRGLHEGAKVIEKHAAQLCVVAEDCDQADYVKLVKALCADHNVKLMSIPSAKTLGEWAGLCKIDSEGKARKVVGCSCVVVKDFGEESEGLHVVQEHINATAGLTRLLLQVFDLHLPTAVKMSVFELASLGFSFQSTRKMSGDEEVAVPVEPVAVAAALGEPMDLLTALQLVLRKSLAHGGLTRGLHEGAKVIEKHAAQLCVVAEDCDQADYVKLVKALCADHNVKLMSIPSAKTLGEWAGLCKIDSEGKARKVVGCSCVVVKDFGEESEGLHVVQEHLKSH